MPLDAGTRLGRYEIRSLIGSGGMGDVYLAQDVPLGRPVALKLLHNELTESKEHLRRFEQEARATSALNHPNIITIYEIGHAEATHFIAAEFVSGQTLRQLMRQPAIKLDAALDIIIQVAAGLSAAHEAGILHRDIKPENIMVRPDGYVKVLDFGLAKLIEERFTQAAASGEATLTAINTNSGTIVGTLSYMAPEQLRSAAVDSRADVWGLGVVLYEMLAGQAPFRGESTADVIVSILEREPIPLPPEPHCPAELAGVAMKALSKEPQNRQQTVGELLDELRALRRKVEANFPTAFARTPVGVTEADADGTIPAAGRDSFRGLMRHPLAQVQTLLGFLALLIAVALAMASHPALKLSLLCALCGDLVLLAYKTLREPARASVQPSPFLGTSLSRLTNIGRVVDAVISPDSKYVAYVREDGGGQSLWMRQVATTVNLQIVPPADVTYNGMSFSLDGDYIYYVIYENINRRLYFLYQIPALGGPPKKVLDDVDTPITFSPDGRQFAFVRGYPSLKETSLIVARSDGTEERRLATRRAGDLFGWRGGPSWSPDGKVIASSAGMYDTDMSVIGVSASDGSMRPLTPRRWPWIGRVAWLPDGSGLALIARDEESGFSQVWLVARPSGKARKITNDLNDYIARGLSVSADSKSLVAVQTDYLSGIWVMPANRPEQRRQITSGRADGFYGLTWTPDGRIIYTSKASGRQDIWNMSADGGSQVQLTFNAGSNYHPCVTPDGQHIIFVSTRTGSPNIWRMEVDGRNPTQLTRGSVPGWPQCTPDNRWLMYKVMGWGKRSLYQMPIMGGEPRLVSENYIGCFAVSPDGQRLACEYWDERLTSQLSLAVMPREGGTLEVLHDNLSTVATSNYIASVIRWTADGTGIAYIDNRGGVSNIWNQPLDGAAPEQLTDFKTDRIFWFDWSRDGKSLACARGVVARDVVLIRLLD